jgi:hypothetical protein
MLDIEHILAEWKKDCVIDDLLLDDASRDSAKLHSKYLEMMSITRLEIKRRDQQFKILLKNKWLHYNGKLSKEEIEELGWPIDPLNGLKLLKGDYDKFYDSDVDIQKAQAKIEYLKNTEYTLKEILDNIKWRHQSIKNTIMWKQFTSGI